MVLPLRILFALTLSHSLVLGVVVSPSMLCTFHAALNLVSFFQYLLVGFSGTVLLPFSLVPVVGAVCMSVSRHASCSSGAMSHIDLRVMMARNEAGF